MLDRKSKLLLRFLDRQPEKRLVFTIDASVPDGFKSIAEVKNVAIWLEEKGFVVVQRDRTQSISYILPSWGKSHGVYLEWIYTIYKE